MVLHDFMALLVLPYWKKESLAQKGRGITRACADDVGMALTSFKFLKLVALVFNQAEIISGLSLKPTKCVIIPTSELLQNDTALYIRNCGCVGWVVGLAR